MTKIIVGPAMRAKFRDLAEPLEFVAEDGRLLDRFSPVATDEADLYRDAEVPVTPDEVQRLLRQPPGRPLADILADFPLSR
jgi:hypothetical protein